MKDCYYNKFVQKVSEGLASWVIKLIQKQKIKKIHL